jgi:FixJ family two-component response regulator
MIEHDHLVVVLDDDSSMISGLDRLLTSHGYKVRLHQDPDTFFSEGLPTVPACLLLDINLNHGKSGIDVHAELLRRGWHLPTIFLTGHWNVQEVVNAIRSGADGFLTKPFDPSELLTAVAEALERAQGSQEQRLHAAEAKARAATLTTREREVVCMVIAGRLNKEIASELSLALITVKVHRGRAMKKLGAGNAADLARIANLAGLVP